MRSNTIFLNYKEHDGYLAVIKKDNQKTELKVLSDSDIEKRSQEEATIFVIPSEKVSIHKLKLPKLAEKKARLAIPYALEEKLGEPIENLHFAFDRQYYEEGEYLVVVCDKSYLSELLTDFKEKNWKVETMTVDWFALKPHEIILLDQKALIWQNDFTGTLAKEFIPFYDFSNPSNIIYTFDKKTKKYPQSTKITEPFPLFAAKRLDENPLFNLCQGAFLQKAETLSTKGLFQTAAGLFGLWILILMSTHLFHLHQLNQQISLVNADIAKIYKQFFPNAKQVISPRFRIEQVIKSQENNNDTFWTLLNGLATVLQVEDVSLESIKYQNNRLSVTLSSQDFGKLEKLQLSLQRQQIKVSQNQASTKDNHVISTMELSL